MLEPLKPKPYPVALEPIPDDPKPDAPAALENSFVMAVTPLPQP